MHDFELKLRESSTSTTDFSPIFRPPLSKRPKKSSGPQKIKFPLTFGLDLSLKTVTKKPSTAPKKKNCLYVTLMTERFPHSKLFGLRLFSNRVIFSVLVPFCGCWSQNVLLGNYSTTTPALMSIRYGIVNNLQIMQVTFKSTFEVWWKTFKFLRFCGHVATMSK